MEGKKKNKWNRKIRTSGMGKEEDVEGKKNMWKGRRKTCRRE